MIVVDAGALVDLLLGQPAVVEAFDSYAHELAHEPLYAPELIHLETLNALRRYLVRGLVREEHATAAAHELVHSRLAQVAARSLSRERIELVG